MFQPFKPTPLNDTQPMTFRDSYTFLERLRLLASLIENTNDNFSEHVAYVAKLIEGVNNRIGSPEVIHVDLNNGNKLVPIPDAYPTNHDFFIVVTQSSAGGNTITLPSNVSGTPYVDSLAGTQSIVHIVPNGDGSFFVDDSMRLLNDLLRSLDVKIESTAEAVNGRITVVETDFAEKLAASGRVSKDYTDSLRVAMVGITDALAVDITTGNNQTKQALEAQIGAAVDNLSQEIALGLAGKVDKSTVINVKDYGAKGNGATDDSEAIQSAINAAGKAQQVYFPAGIYVISKTIKTLVSQTIVGASSNGEGGNKTEIKSTHGGVAVELANGVTITRLKFNGPGFGVVGSTAIRCEAIQCTIREVSIWEYGTGIALKEVWLGMVDRAQIKVCRRAMDVDYCYNLTISSPMIYCKCAPTIRGEGIICRNQSMVNIFGGSIELYTTAIAVAPNGLVACFGVYFETMNIDNNPNKARGIYASSVGAGAMVTAIGCQVYLNDMQSFIEFDVLDAGEAIVAMGNKFKSEGAGACIAYNLRNMAAVSIPNIRVVLMGDSWASTAGDGHRFMRTDTMTPIGSIINPPMRDYGADGLATNGRLRYGGSIEANSYRTDVMNVDTIVGYIKPGSLPRAYTVAELPGNWSAKKGAIVWNEALGKLMVWTGTQWTNLTGGAL